MRLAVDDRSCTRARLVLSLALDGEAAASDDAFAAARHFCSCRACAEFASHAAALTDVLRSYRRPMRSRSRIDHSKGA